MLKFLTEAYSCQAGRLSGGPDRRAAPSLTITGTRRDLVSCSPKSLYVSRRPGTHLAAFLPGWHDPVCLLVGLACRRRVASRRQAMHLNDAKGQGTGRHDTRSTRPAMKIALVNCTTRLSSIGRSRSGRTSSDCVRRRTLGTPPEAYSLTISPTGPFHQLAARSLRETTWHEALPEQGQRTRHHRRAGGRHGGDQPLRLLHRGDYAQSYPFHYPDELAADLKPYSRHCLPRLDRASTNGSQIVFVTPPPEGSRQSSS